jgi:hypothetical protein
MNRVKYCNKDIDQAPKYDVNLLNKKKFDKCGIMEKVQHMK